MNLLNVPINILCKSIDHIPVLVILEDLEAIRAVIASECADEAQEIKWRLWYVHRLNQLRRALGLTPLTHREYLAEVEYVTE